MSVLDEGEVSGRWLQVGVASWSASALHKGAVSGRRLHPLFIIDTCTSET